MKNNTQQIEKIKSDPIIQEESDDNLGLDSDHSSDGSKYGYLNNDNDRISHNLDGETDDTDTDELPGHSPLMDK